MHARARVVAVAEAGWTRLATMRSETPLLVRRTGGPGGTAQVHLVGGAAGPLGGDQLRLEIEVGPGAGLCVRTVAASVALPGPPGTRSWVEVVARVAAGGRLAWLPEPLIAAANCRHLATSRVTLAEGAALVWRDELVCGRYGEEPGDAVVALTVSYAGEPLLQHELAVGAAAPGWDGPAVLDRAGATGSLLRVDPAWAQAPPEPAVLSPTAALLPLAGPAVLATATGPDHATVRRLLDRGMNSTRHELDRARESSPGYEKDGAR